MNILILDDDETRIKCFKEKYYKNNRIFITTGSIKTAITFLEKIKIDFLFLDHDLNGKIMQPSDENSGFAVAKWLSNNRQHMPKKIVLHSLNDIGRKNIKKLLPNAIEKPFAWLKNDIKVIGNLIIFE